MTITMANCHEHPGANDPTLSCWALRHYDLRRVTDAEMLAIIQAIPNLQPVIDWLDNGCSAKAAADELRIYQRILQDVLRP